jgi:hypothetical protein
MAPGQIDELRSVLGLSDDLEARALQEAGQSLPEKDIVVGKDHPGHSHRAFLRVEAAGWIVGREAVRGRPQADPR